MPITECSARGPRPSGSDRAARGRSARRLIVALAQLGRVERNLLEQPLEHGVQAARADILGAGVDRGRDFGERRDRVVGESTGADPRSPSAPTYCRVSAFSGSVRMRMKSSLVRAFSSTRIGKRPWNSGIRSEGLLMWNAPEATNRIWSVRTAPYLVLTVEPSTIGSRSRWTPSRETSGPRPPRARRSCRSRR